MSIFILNHPNFLRGFLIQRVPEVPVETSGMQQSCFIAFLSNVQLEKLIKSKHCTGFHGGCLFFFLVIVLTQNRQHPTAVCTGPSPSAGGWGITRYCSCERHNKPFAYVIPRDGQPLGHSSCRNERYQTTDSAPNLNKLD